MSGWLDKIKNMITPDRGNKAADGIEKHATNERIDSGLNRVPGGSRLGDKVPDDANVQAADAVRDNFGDDKPKPRT